MSNLVIVALPEESDHVNKISSEKVPHLTLLFLGEDSGDVANLTRIIDYVKHACSQTLRQFSLEVASRGTLGDQSADVLFFSKADWSGFKGINEFRSNLLKDPNIKTAYDSTEQFPEWVPHLTLGYPETPAKPDDREYPKISYVSFDRIAVWYGEYEGVEIPLKRYDDSVSGVPMSGIKTVEDVLEHFGVKGMKWGVRRARERAGDVAVGGLGISTTGSRARASARDAKKKAAKAEVHISDKRKKLKTSGGKGHPAHPDAVRARTLGQIGKKSGLKSLSDQELQAYAHRLQLEQNVKRLNYNEMNPGKKFVATILGRSGSSLASEGLNKGTKEAGKRALKYAAK